jgi:hypothetical protein
VCQPLFSLLFAKLLNSFSGHDMADKIQQFSLNFVEIGAAAMVLFYGSCASVEAVRPAAVHV